MSWSNKKGFILIDDPTGITAGTNETLVVGSSGNLVAYPVSKTIDGDTFNVGYTTGGGNDGARTRATTPVHQAGCHLAANGGTQKVFRIDVPAGTYTIGLCIGDQSNDRALSYVEINDNTTNRATINISSTIAAGQYGDASGVIRSSAANWESNNVTVSVSITSGILAIKFGHPSTASDETAITFITVQASGSTTVTPGVGAVTLQGKQPTTSAFTAVRIREVLVNQSGQVVANAANIRLMVWYGGQCRGQADFSVNGQTSDANGTTSWSIATGTLALNDPIFFVAQDSISFSNYAAGRMTPSYE